MLQHLGEAVEVRLDRVVDLRRSETAERAVRRCVRRDRPADDVDVGARRTGRRRGARPARARPGVSVQYAPASRMTSISWATIRPSRIDPGPVADDRRVALRRRGDVLVPVVDHPDGPAALQGEDARVEREDRGVLLLAPEAAAGLGLDDADLGPPAGRGRGPSRCGRSTGTGALPWTVTPPSGPGHGDHRHRLDVELLLVAGPIGALEDDVGRRRRPAAAVALHDVVAREDRARSARGRASAGSGSVRGLHGRERDGEGRSIGSGDERERLGVVADLAADRHEDRLVVVDEADDVVAGDVGGRRDDDAVPVGPPSSRSMASRRAWASVERTVAPNHAPGNTRSSAYFASPVSFSGPSRRSGNASIRPRLAAPGLTVTGFGAAVRPGVVVVRDVGVAGPSCVASLARTMQARARRCQAGWTCDRSGRRSGSSPARGVAVDRRPSAGQPRPWRRPTPGVAPVWRACSTTMVPLTTT